VHTVGDSNVIAWHLYDYLAPSNFLAYELSDYENDTPCIFEIKVKYRVQLWSIYG
jgi:hypothetical protein